MKSAYLARNRISTHTKQGTLSRCQEVHRAWLERVTGVVNLLRKVEAVVGYS